MERGNLLVKTIDIATFHLKASSGYYIMYKSDYDLLIYNYII